jgi:succinylglutamate desuccinylase
MEPAFENFQTVKRGQVLARDNKGPIKAIESGMVLLPLYQRLGDDGFFLGRTVKPFWLKLSALLRRMKVGDYVHLLPGVRRQTMDSSSLTVDTRSARILPLQVFHLLGFRKLRWAKNVLIVNRRRYDLAGPEKRLNKEIHQ